MIKKLINFAVFVIQMSLVLIPLLGLPFIKQHILTLANTERIQLLTGCILSLIWGITFQVNKIRRQIQTHNFIAALVIVFLFIPEIFSKYVLLSFSIFTFAQLYFVFIATVFAQIKELREDFLKKISNDKEKKDE